MSTINSAAATTRVTSPPPRRILVEFTAIEAATALGAIVGRREYLRERVANLHPDRLDPWSRELRDVEAAEATLRRALGVAREVSA